MEFYQDLLKLYGRLKIPKQYEDISMLNKNISWYLSDVDKTLVGYKENPDQFILEIDISGAYPALCHVCFPNKVEFLNKLDSINDKLQKNIFLTNTLKQNENVLKSFARMCKGIIFGLVIDIVGDEFDLLEIKKDSCLILCNQKQKDLLINLEKTENEFSRFILNNNFNFHIEFYKFYMRHSKTSFFLTQNNSWKLKGNYQLIPQELKNIMTDIVDDNYSKTEELKKIYSINYFKIVKLFGLNKLLEKFYICDKKILTVSGKYEKFNFKTKVNPNLYLKLFINPILIVLSQKN